MQQQNKNSSDILENQKQLDKEQDFIDFGNVEELMSKDRKDLSSSQRRQLKKFLKTNKKGLFGLIFPYILKHWVLSLIVILFTLVSTLAVVMGPKVVERLIGTLTAKQFEASFMVDPTWNGSFFDWIINTPGKIDEYNALIHNSYSYVSYSADGNYYSLLFGMELTWTGWVYTQLVLLGISSVATFITNFFASLVGRKIEIDLRNRTLERLVKQDMSYYADKKIGEILTKIVSDTQIIGDQAAQVPQSILSAVTTFIGAIIIMWTIDSSLSIVVLVTMIILITIVICMFILARKFMFKLRSSITTINGDVTDRINTVRLIKASGTENYETERFKEVHKDYYKKSKGVISIQTIIRTILIAGISSIQVIIISAAAILYHGQADKLVAVLTSFISSIGVMISPIMQLVGVVIGIIQGSTASQRVWNIIASKSRMNPHYEDGEGIYIDKIEGDIIFKDVVFAYPDKPDQVILPKFNFTFKQGKYYAFVGETGVGKSTISKLLLRFYDPTQGEVLINNNINIKDVHLASYLDKVGYVEQEPQILFGNVFDNIRYARFDASDEEVIAACKKAELHDLVLTWPDGYNTVLGERGFMLSGGQKQRLVIARMFLKNPQLLILDEATSALDNIVEKEIQGNLEELSKGRTTFSIAHRLSTIKNADAIIVLAKNVGIAQVGTFNELKNKPGRFKDLYDAGLMS